MKQKFRACLVDFCFSMFILLKENFKNKFKNQV